MLSKIGSISFGGFEANFLNSLHDVARKYGIVILNPGQADLHIHLNPYLKSLPGDPRKTIAVIAEPMIVRPDLYQEKVMNKYLECVTISTERSANLAIKIISELPINIPRKLVDEVKRDRQVCLVAGHKFSASRLSNYGLRRIILKSEIGSRIDLFGPDWLDPLWLEARRRLYAGRLQLKNLRDFSPKEWLGNFGHIFTNYKGIMDSKFHAMRRYDFSLVIENQSDYVSEKVWISIARGAVPIYIGPSLRALNADLENVVFQVEPSVSAIKEVLDHVTKDQIASKRIAGYKFLEGDWIKANSNQEVADRYFQFVMKFYA